MASRAHIPEIDDLKLHRLKSNKIKKSIINDPIYFLYGLPSTIQNSSKSFGSLKLKRAIY